MAKMINLNVRPVFVFDLDHNDRAAIFYEVLRKPTVELVQVAVDVGHQLGVVGSKLDVWVFLEQPERKSAHVAIWRDYSILSLLRLRLHGSAF